MHDIYKQATASTKANFDDALTGSKAMITGTTSQDTLDSQTKFVHASLKKAVAETSMLTDASLKLAERALTSLSMQMNAVAEKLAKVV